MDDHPGRRRLEVLTGHLRRFLVAAGNGQEARRRIVAMAGGGETSGVPARPADQRLEALRKANEIRVHRSQLKKDLATGRVQIVDILARPPEFAETERVSVLLLAVPGYGSARVARLLAKARISDSKRLAGLTERQRAELVKYFQR
jgi:S13-like H2TH domain